MNIDIIWKHFWYIVQDIGRFIWHLLASLFRLFTCFLHGVVGLFLWNCFVFIRLFKWCLVTCCWRWPHESVKSKHKLTHKVSMTHDHTFVISHGCHRNQYSNCPLIKIWKDATILTKLKNVRYAVNTSLDLRTIFWMRYRKSLFYTTIEFEVAFSKI